MLSIPLVLAVSAAYLLLLFMVARHAERRARVGRSLIDNPWVYTLSIAVYCTAWTYFGSVGRAASAGLASCRSIWGRRWRWCWPGWWCAA